MKTQLLISRSISLKQINTSFALLTNHSVSELYLKSVKSNLHLKELLCGENRLILVNI